jgi:hypothetical protein
MRLKHKTTGEMVDAYVCFDADYPLILTSGMQYRITAGAENDWEVKRATRIEVSELYTNGFEKLAAGFERNRGFAE